mmetsp:Transcript_58518/g.124104  ORF Transcript_58518/g.124104 Transcript_58518/m.124104 type:complete len:257 (-) Transcript_58518:1343-2113(-)
MPRRRQPQRGRGRDPGGCSSVAGCQYPMGCSFRGRRTADQEPFVQRWQGLAPNRGQVAISALGHSSPEQVERFVGFDGFRATWSLGKPCHFRKEFFGTNRSGFKAECNSVRCGAEGQLGARIEEIDGSPLLTPNEERSCERGRRFPGRCSTEGIAAEGGRRVVAQLDGCTAGALCPQLDQRHSEEGDGRSRRQVRHGGIASHSVVEEALQPSLAMPPSGGLRNVAVECCPCGSFPVAGLASLAGFAAPVPAICTCT